MKRILITFLFLLLTINPISAQELTGTLEQIKKSGVIRVGYRTSHPPMSFLGPDGMPTGYSIELGKKIVAEIEKQIGGKVKVEYVPVTAEDRFQALVENKIDLLCGATTKTLSRSEIVDFTQLTFATGASFMTLRHKPIKGNFAGKKIGVVKGTTTENQVKALLKETQVNTEIILLNSTDEGVSDLYNEKIDAFAADQVVLIGLAISATNSNVFDKNAKRFLVMSDLFSYEPLALAVRRNDADFRLTADRVISDLCKSREILEIYDRWFSKFSNERAPSFEALVQLNAIPE